MFATCGITIKLVTPLKTIVVFCIENNLPYPGFLVLDTPLLTYREPMTSRYGDLSDDEKVIKKTGLAEHFYKPKHLASLKDKVQFIVIENSDPPTAIWDVARIETFRASKAMADLVCWQDVCDWTRSLKINFELSREVAEFTNKWGKGLTCCCELGSECLSIALSPLG